MAHIEYIVDDQRYEALLDAVDNSIGRARECKIQLLHDPELSRVHCTVQRQSDGSFVLVDEGSTNGTFLNDQRVANEERPLQDGDRIRVGTTVLVFHEQDAGRTACIFGEVKRQMERGEGFHTIMGKILHGRKGAATADQPPAPGSSDDAPPPGGAGPA